jgi:hypothetical protein
MSSRNIIRRPLASVAEQLAVWALGPVAEQLAVWALAPVLNRSGRTGTGANAQRLIGVGR